MTTDPLVRDSYLDPDVTLDAYALLRVAQAGDTEAARVLVEHARNLPALALRVARFGAMTLAEYIGHDQAAAVLRDATLKALAQGLTR